MDEPTEVVEKVSKSSDWVKVFEELEKDKNRLLSWELNIKGVKKKFSKDEVIFFLGDMRCVLTPDGWLFYTR